MHCRTMAKDFWTVHRRSDQPHDYGEATSTPAMTRKLLCCACTTAHVQYNLDTLLYLRLLGHHGGVEGICWTWVGCSWIATLSLPLQHLQSARTSCLCSLVCIWVWVSEVRHCGEGVQIGVVQSIHCECSLRESDCAVYRTFTVPSPLNMHTWHSITGIYSVYKKFIKWCVYVCVCVC